MKTLIAPMPLPAHETEALVIIANWTINRLEFHNVSYAIRKTEFTTNENSIIKNLMLDVYYVGYVGNDGTRIIQQTNESGTSNFILITSNYIYGQITGVWHRFPRSKRRK